MHRVLLREDVIDCPSSTFVATRRFWAAALTTSAEVVDKAPEFTSLGDPASMGWVGRQDVGQAEARYHLGIETDDVGA